MSRALCLALLCAAACHSSLSDPGDAASDAANPLAVGRRYIDARGCPNCHQSDNPADGTLSGQSMPRPGTLAYGANLTPDPDTGIGTWSDDDLKRAMRSGLDDTGAPLCPPMPHFDGTGGDYRPMTDPEATAIIAYLRSLPAIKRAIPDSYCPPIKSPALDLAMAPADLAVPEEMDRDMTTPPVDMGEND
jgi:hypothetical protein